MFKGTFINGESLVISSIVSFNLFFGGGGLFLSNIKLGNF